MGSGRKGYGKQKQQSMLLFRFLITDGNSAPHNVNILQQGHNFHDFIKQFTQSSKPSQPKSSYNIETIFREFDDTSNKVVIKR